MKTIMKKLHTHIVRWKKDQQGVISVEMALIATAVFFAALPLSDLAARVYNSLQLSNSLRAAMQYAIEHPDDEAGIQNVALGNAGSLDTEQMSVDPDQFCECNGSTYNCADTCGYGMQTYLSITATYNQELLMDYPGYGNVLPMTKELTVRIE